MKFSFSLYTNFVRKDNGQVVESLGYMTLSFLPSFSFSFILSLKQAKKLE